MNYSIQILEREKHILEKCLNEWETKEYQEAKKERENKLKDINDSIIKLNDAKRKSI